MFSGNIFPITLSISVLKENYYSPQKTFTRTLFDSCNQPMCTFKLKVIIEMLYSVERTIKHHCVIFHIHLHVHNVLAFIGLTVFNDLNTSYWE